MKLENNKNILEVRDIKKSFGSKNILNGVTFDLKRGQKVALIGENGSGKTVLMEIIATLIKQDSGNIIYNFSSKDNSIANNIGMQFQDSIYPNGITIKILVDFYLKIYKDKVDLKSVDKLKNIFELKKFEDINISSLSGGQKQRINLFLAIIHNPKFLILDEISTGLDIKAKKEIINFIKEMDKKLNLSIIIISHNTEEIEYLADRVLLLKDGKIASDITKSQIIKKYKTINNYLMKVI